MNYGKLTAGTTKTAIDTAKPSEKGEIITYLSRMGDVLQDILKRRNVHFLTSQAVHSVCNGNIAYIVFWEKDFDIAASFDIIPTEPR